MTPNIVDIPADIAGRLLIGNEIEQELLADGLLAQCPEDTCLSRSRTHRSRRPSNEADFDCIVEFDP